MFNEIWNAPFRADNNIIPNLCTNVDSFDGALTHAQSVTVYCVALSDTAVSLLGKCVRACLIYQHRDVTARRSLFKYWTSHPINHSHSAKHTHTHKPDCPAHLIHFINCNRSGMQIITNVCSGVCSCVCALAKDLWLYYGKWKRTWARKRGVNGCLGKPGEDLSDLRAWYCRNKIAPPAHTPAVSGSWSSWHRLRACCTLSVQID